MPRKSSPRRPKTAKPAQILKPIIMPVVQRLDRHEQLLLDLKAALDVQFQRIAAIQAQLDQMMAKRHQL
jgi:hypothetical protein